MELREIIEQAAHKLGKQRKVAEIIGVHPDVLTAAKAGRRGLPEVACGKLAEILGIDRWTVIAASALVTEKNPEKRAYLAPFVQTLPRKAAAWVMGIASAATIGTTAPTDAIANDTLKVSSPAPQPAPLQGFATHEIGIMSTIRRAISRTIGLVRSSFSGGLPRFGFSGL
jgi:hypothetical protein